MIVRLASVLVALSVSLIGADAGRAQSCDTLLGGRNCGAPGAAYPSVPDMSSGSAGRTGLSVQDLGMASQMSGSQPAMFGAITFGGSGVTCSGPFRVRRC
jgi:hypothetical protein